jgi:hypothetical protein
VSRSASECLGVLLGVTECFWVSRSASGCHGVLLSASHLLLFVMSLTVVCGLDMCVQVAPALQRIDQSLLTVSLFLALSLGSGEVLTLVEGESGPATLKTLSGDEARRYENRIRSDDGFAMREQQRAQRRLQEDGSGVKPVYCDSRYYKILAGGNGQGGVGCN